MQDSDGYPLKEATGYFLTEDGLLKLESIRDQLLFMGTLAYPHKDHEEGVFLEVTRETLGESYDVFARQIMDLISGEIKQLRMMRPQERTVN